jgi:hypothetical protein
VIHNIKSRGKVWTVVENKFSDNKRPPTPTHMAVETISEELGTGREEKCEVTLRILLALT